MMLTQNEEFSLGRINVGDLIKYAIVSDTWKAKFEIFDERYQCFSVRLDRAVLVPFLLE
jgi:hypothetical protein